jgi:penicillin-binding protein 2
MTDNSRVRVSIVGVIVVALFGALVARLWFLQVGSSTTYEVKAEQRALRTVQTEAPRGQILDAAGQPLVTNKVVWSLTMDRDVDEKTRATVFGRLAELLGGKTTPKSLEKRFNDVRQSPLRPALVVIDTPLLARVTVLEHPQDYPGITVVEQTVREYPQGQLAAHVLGYVGEVNPEELKKLKGYVNGDTIGRSGIEAAYEKVLRGVPKRETYEVDPTGRPVGDPIKVRPSTVGDNVKLTIDARVQKDAENALATGVLLAKNNRTFKTKTGQYPFKAPGGAVVVLDAQTGGVVALASNPAYDPSAFIGGISNDAWKLLNDENGPHPLSNRATQGLYAPGSTFKLVTATAANRYGIRAYNHWYTDKGFIEVGNDKRSFHNSGNKAYGPIELSKALTVSSDAYFYEIGYDFWKHWSLLDSETGDGIQTTARDFGFGTKTGIEISESDGRVPDAEWKKRFARILYPLKGTDEEKAVNQQKFTENSRWYPGDNVNLSVGQGDLVVTPLQIADAYATFANGGTLYQPHLAEAITDGRGKVVKRFEPKAVRTIAFDPNVYSTMSAGFTGAVQDPEGTANPAFAGFDFAAVPVAGKTGTAQVSPEKDGTPRGDTSWFAGYFTVNGRQYVAVTVVEQAGFGSEVAAPITRNVIESIAKQPLTPLETLIKPAKNGD